MCSCCQLVKKTKIINYISIILSITFFKSINCIKSINVLQVLATGRAYNKDDSWEFIPVAGKKLTYKIRASHVCKTKGESDKACKYWAGESDVVGEASTDHTWKLVADGKNYWNIVNVKTEKPLFIYASKGTQELEFWDTPHSRSLTPWQFELEEA